jgi:hypothetical protein
MSSLRKNQPGFRQGRSIVSQCAALRRISEKINNNLAAALVVYILRRPLTPSIELTCWIFLDLRTYGVPDKLVTDIGHTYQHTIAHVTSLYGVKDDFEIQAAVLWGDTLGPFLSGSLNNVEELFHLVEASVLKFGLGMNVMNTNKAMV